MLNAGMESIRDMLHLWFDITNNISMAVYICIYAWPLCIYYMYIYIDCPYNGKTTFCGCLYHSVYTFYWNHSDIHMIDLPFTKGMVPSFTSKVKSNWVLDSLYSIIHLCYSSLKTERDPKVMDVVDWLLQILQIALTKQTVRKISKYLMLLF